MEIGGLDPDAIGEDAELVVRHYLVFELLAPLVELVGLVLVPLALAVGAVDLGFAWRFACVAYGYAMLINLVALAVEEYTFHRYSPWGDLGAAVVASILENLGYRQLTPVWRVQGAWSALRGRQREWGAMTRAGFGGERASDASH